MALKFFSGNFRATDNIFFSIGLIGFLLFPLIVPFNPGFLIIAYTVVGYLCFRFLLSGFSNVTISSHGISKANFLGKKTIEWNMVKSYGAFEGSRPPYEIKRSELDKFNFGFSFKLFLSTDLLAKVPFAWWLRKEIIAFDYRKEALLLIEYYLNNTGTKANWNSLHFYRKTD